MEYGANALNPVEDDHEMWAISLYMNSGHADQEVIQLLISAGANVDVGYRKKVCHSSKKKNV